MARIKFSKKTEPTVKTTTNTTEITGGIVTNTATNVDTVSLGGTIVFEEETKAPAPKEEKFERPKFIRINNIFLSSYSSLLYLVL